jgi:DNA-binding MarR family transcriptional regulator
MDRVRWLTEAEQRTWRAFVGATRLVFDELDRELQRDAGMPHAYYVVLVALSEAPDRRMRMTDLAAATGSSRSRLSHAVARLEEAGWVERQPCQHDRRGADAVLTEAGMAVLAAAAPRHVEGVRRHLFDRLDHEQVGQLRDLCEAVLGDTRGPAAWPAGSGRAIESTGE